MVVEVDWCDWIRVGSVFVCGSVSEDYRVIGLLFLI